MATLPTLPTGNILIVAYWNATQHGHDTPTDVTPLVEYGNVTEFDVRDNGADLTIEENNQNARSTQTYHYRYKSDGWCIAWLTRDTIYERGTWGHGLHHLLPDVANTTLPQTTLVTVLQKMWGQFPSGSQADIAAADVAYHYPPNPSATSISLGGLQQGHVGPGDDARGGKTRPFSYGEGATIYQLIGAGFGEGENNYGRGKVLFNGEPIISSENYEEGSRDLLADNLVPGPETICDFRVRADTDVSYAEGALMGVWS